MTEIEQKQDELIKHLLLFYDGNIEIINLKIWETKLDELKSELTQLKKRAEEQSKCPKCGEYITEHDIDNGKCDYCWEEFPKEWYITPF